MISTITVQNITKYQAKSLGLLFTDYFRNWENEKRDQEKSPLYFMHGSKINDVQYTFIDGAGVCHWGNTMESCMNDMLTSYMKQATYI